MTGDESKERKQGEHTVAREGELEEDILEELLVRADKAGEDGTEMDRIVAEIDEIAARHPGPATWYAGAYARYLHPARRRSVEMQTSVDDLLRRTLGSAPAEYRAWLYLGHNRYDLGEHAAARGHFEEAARLAPEPDYLGLKARELAVCCSLTERGVAGAIEELEAYVASAARHPVEDIWPAELARVLRAKLAAPLPREMGDRLLVLARRLDAAGHFGAWLTDIVPKTKGDGG